MQNSVFAFLRYGDVATPPVLVVCNMTPVPRIGYRIGVPRPGRWQELLNTDAAFYGGSGMGNGGAVQTVPVQRHGEAQSLELTLPPLVRDCSLHAERLTGLHACSICPTGCCRAGRFRSARHGTGSASTSRCSRRMRSEIELCLFEPSGRHEIARYTLPECTDEVWHGYLPDATAGLLYGYRAYGPYEPEQGHRFNPHKLLLDPYARGLAGERALVGRAVRLSCCIHRAATCRSIAATVRRRCRKAW